MAKRSMTNNVVLKNSIKHKASESEESKSASSKDYCFHMSMSPSVENETHWFQLLPAAFFTAVVILITRMHVYTRPMQDFYWFSGDNQLTDFFSYYKMVAVMTFTVLAIIIITYRIFTQSFAVKRSFVYLPMAVYIVFVILSYISSEYKVFALWGFNDRFEGTLPLIAYMLMLFYIINSVNTEKNVKFIIYPLAFFSFVLSIIGVSQATGHDFFQTTFGKKLITPNWFWGQIDKLHFTFKNNEIYQTVYNINYVSFYLTLLIPLFGLLFIRSVMKGKEEPIWKKIIWGGLFSLLIFNLIGSASSGGFLGMFIVVLAGIIVLNKRIVTWWKPVVLLLLLTVLVSGATYERWLPELTNTFNGINPNKSTATTSGAEVITTTEQALAAAGSSNTEDSATAEKHKIDFIQTSGTSILISYDGNAIAFQTYPKSPTSLKVTDNTGVPLDLVPTDINPVYQVSDSRFPKMTVRPATDDAGNNYFVLGINGNEWPFRLTETGPKYITISGQLINLREIPAIGWENNQAFGSGRGYIWSRTIPMMKETLLLGHGADTYCLYFPQDDYIGKFNSEVFSSNLSIIVDKPHNMYFGAFIGTGGISVLALLVLWGYYVLQSFRLYFRQKFDSFISYVGVGIFLGICGFLVSGFVDDSTISVMPMFYGLLGTGIAINMMLKRHRSEPEKTIQ